MTVNAPKFAEGWGELVQEHGWPAFRGSLMAYLAQDDIGYMSPKHFAGTFGKWLARAPAAATSGSSEARHMTPEFKELEARAKAEREAKKASA